MSITSLNYYGMAYNGFAFGGAGSPYQITAVDGLVGLPDIRVQDDTQGFNDGMFSGRDFLGGRKVTVTILTLAGNGYTAQYNYNLLKAALLPQSSYTAFASTNQLQFQLSAASGLQFLNARVRANKTIVDPNFTYGYITSQWEFFCPDPKFYDNTQQLASLIGSNYLGRLYNRVYPLTFGGGAAGTTITNAGWANSYPIITITGPITNPIVGNSTQGTYITIQGTYANTDTIVVDLGQRLVTWNGSSARNLVTGGSNWFWAQPGANQFYLSGTGTLAGTTSATVTWYNAYV
jgi:Phage tail protein